MTHPAQFGQPAPSFTAPVAFPGEALSAPLRPTSLGDYAGRWLVFFWYSLDFTIVCLTEITALSDRLGEFNDREPKWSEAKPFVYPPSRQQPVVDGRHFGSANILWFDGHVSAKRPVASHPAKFSKGEVTVNQLQQLNQDDTLKEAYTGKLDQDSYHYNLSKADR